MSANRRSHRPQVRTVTGLQRRQDGVTRRRHLDLDRGFARADRILAGMEDRGLSRIVYSDGRRGYHVPEQDG